MQSVVVGMQIDTILRGIAAPINFVVLVTMSCFLLINILAWRMEARLTQMGAQVRSQPKQLPQDHHFSDTAYTPPELFKGERQ